MTLLQQEVHTPKTPRSVHRRVRLAPLTLCEATTLEELRRWEPEWHELLAQQHAPPPNCHHQRFREVVATLGSDVSPYLAMWFQGDDPVAMILGRVANERVACRIGYLTIPLGTVKSLGVVYGGLIPGSSKSTNDAVMQHLRWLLATGGIDRLTINHLDANNALSPALMNLNPIEDKTEPHWVIHLKDGDLDATLARHSAKHRSNLRRLDRRLTRRFEGDVELKCVREPSEAAEFADMASTIAARTYHRRLPTGTDNPDQWKRILEVEAEAGRLMCFILMAQGRPIAYQAGTRYGNRYFCEGTSYLPEFADMRPGTVLFMRVLRSLCESGIEIVDFGFGDAEYKSIYGDTAQAEVSLRLYATNPRSRILAGADRALHVTRDLATHATQSLGLFRGLRKRWRTRMTTASTRRAAHGNSSTVEPEAC